MGLEDYRVLLKPKFKKSVFADDYAYSSLVDSASPARPVLTVRQVETALGAMGFLEDSRSDRGQMTPYRNDSLFTATLPQEAERTPQSALYVVEALVRGRDDARCGEKLCDSVSVRFAVCQPESASWYFLRLIKHLCDTLPLAVVHENKTYAPEVFWAFRLHANEQIRAQRAIWIGIVDGDEDAPTLSVGDTWSYFLNRNPGMRADPERTLAPGHPCLDVEKTVDMTIEDAEATMAPAVREAVAALRTRVRA